MGRYVVGVDGGTAEVESDGTIVAVSDRRLGNRLRRNLALTAVIREVTGTIGEATEEDAAIFERIREYRPGHPMHVFATLFLMDADFVIPTDDIERVRAAGYNVSDEGLLVSSD